MIVRRVERPVDTIRFTDRRWRIYSNKEDQEVLDRKFSRLKTWIEDNGGYVHNALKLQNSKKPPYLTLRTKFDIGMDEIDRPCIALPLPIVIDRLRALEDLEQVMIRAGCPPLYNRSTVEIFAVFIAYHRQQGKESMWFPLVQSLQEIPPNPWLLPIRDLKEIEFDEEIQDMVRKERSGNDIISRQLHTLYGQFLGLSTEVLLWAIAQAQSISFIDQDGCIWYPLLHFLQHDRTQPPIYRHDEGRFVTWGWMDRPFSAGEHLTINNCMKQPILLYLTRRIVSENL